MTDVKFSTSTGKWIVAANPVILPDGRGFIPYPSMHEAPETAAAEAWAIDTLSMLSKTFRVAK